MPIWPPPTAERPAPLGCRSDEFAAATDAPLKEDVPLEITFGRMANGPIWFTDVNGLDYGTFRE